MKYIGFFVGLFLTSIFLGGCAKSYHSTTQIEDSAFLVLKGNYLGTEVTIGDQVLVIDKNTKEYSIDGQKVAKFPLTVGSHDLTIRRNGLVIHSQKLFLTNSQSVEVSIP